MAELPVQSSVQFLGYLLGLDHMAVMLGRATALVTQFSRQNVACDVQLRFDQVVWYWTLHVRSVLEDMVAVTPSQPLEDFVKLQRQALHIFVAEGRFRCLVPHRWLMKRTWDLEPLRTDRVADATE